MMGTEDKQELLFKLGTLRVFFDQLKELNEKVEESYQLGYDELEYLVSTHISEEQLEEEEVLFNEDSHDADKKDRDHLQQEAEEFLKGWINEIMDSLGVGKGS